jgi:Phosphatidylglycerol lysyltransferase, C-terminal
MSTINIPTEIALTRQVSNQGPKKRSRCRHEPAKAAEVKLFETLGKILIENIASVDNHDCCPPQARILSPDPNRPPHHTAPVINQLAKAEIDIVTATVEHTENTPCNASEQTRTSNANRPMKAKYKKEGTIFTLEDIAAIDALKDLVVRFGKVSHMGILDQSYSFFLNKHRDGALHFKVRDKVAVVGGDPLCEPGKYDSLLEEFAHYRKQFGWSIGFLGATSELAVYARKQKWVTMRFGVERVLNPMTNSVLLETGGGKRIISQSKQLLRKHVTLGTYRPTHSNDPVLQEQLVNIYESWCSDRNRNNPGTVQAYVTVYDPFAMPELMTYIYTKDADGKPCGFAALRKIVDGYHIDPCIALPGAPRCISELLILCAMALLHRLGISHLSLGIEPSNELAEITGLSKPMLTLTRVIHRRIYRSLSIAGKRGFHDKFRPDDELQGDLYLVFPKHPAPAMKHMVSLMHTANISILKLIAGEVRRSLVRSRSDRTRKKADEVGKTCCSIHSGSTSVQKGEGR